MFSALPNAQASIFRYMNNNQKRIDLIHFKIKINQAKNHLFSPISSTQLQSLFYFYQLNFTFFRQVFYFLLLYNTMFDFLFHFIIQLMYFLLLILLFQITNNIYYNFTDTLIDISLLSTGNVGNSSTTDTCNKFIIRNFQIYHLSTEEMYRGWLKNSLSSPTSSLNLSSLTTSVIDFDVSSDQSQLVFYLYSLLGLGNSETIYSINSQYTISQVSSLSQSAVPFQIFIMNNYTIDFYGSSTSFLQPAIQKRNESSSAVVGSITGSSNYLKMAVSPNYQIGVTWTSQTSCLFYNLTSLTQIGSYTPISTPSANVTKSITFSKDSLYAVIQTDNYNPIVILYLTNFTVAYTATVVDTINDAYFLDNSSTILVVNGNAALVFVNLTSNKLYSIPPITTTLFGADQQNNIFTCYGNTITQSLVTFTAVINNPTNNSTNTSFNNGTSNNSTSNQTSNSHTSSLIKPIYFDPTQQLIMDRINQTLLTVTGIANNIANVAASAPISIYFLGFLNFITTSTLYVLLNFPIPEHIYNFLIALSNDISSGILTILGISYTLPQLTDQKVTSQKALYFGISSDIFVENTSNIGFFLFSTIFISVVVWVAQKLLKKSNVVRRWLVGQKVNMIYGQIIGLMQSFILPWSFILFSLQQRNLRTKLNSTLYSIFFLLFTLFPFYYFLALLLQSKSSITQPSLRIKKTFAFRLEWIRQTKFRLTDQVNLKSLKTFYELINPQLLSNWYLCFTNYIFPLLVLLPNPNIFLVVIFLYDILGIGIALKQSKHRINGVFLSFYPFLLHCCFGIFYWCPSDYIISIAEIACFVILLTGIAHNMLTIVIQLFLNLKKLICQCCHRNRVIDRHRINPKTDIIKNGSKIKAKSKIISIVNNNLYVNKPLPPKQNSPTLLPPNIETERGTKKYVPRTMRVKATKQPRQLKFLVIQK